jgi:hypothetical protein
VRILFDNGVPKAVAKSLTEHQVTFSRKLVWHEFENGQLIQKAEDAGFDLLLTTDKNIQYQQNLTGRKIALIVLGNQQWPMVKLHLEKIVAAVNESKPGSYIKVPIPFAEKGEFTF